MTTPNVQVKRYRNDKQYQKDAARMEAEGWRITATVSETKRTGCTRFILLGGIGALVFHPKPQLVVTYRKSS